MDLGGELLERPKREEKTNGLNNISKNEWPTPHPNGNGLNERNGNDEEQPGEGGFNALSNADTGNEYGDVADTGHTGLQGSKVNGSTGGSGKESDKLTTRCVRSNWQNFPTQSPICSRNDGISSRLDGITFSKWRNESIKAAGNAIVPQVVYQIFKAIEQYETLP
jgi:DNA (cytosine-5)-methyltransferase 1